MDADKRAIRDSFDSWQRASAAGNVSVLMTLMAEDAVFLTPGRPPVRGRAEFATLLEALFRQYRTQSQWTLEEIQVHGEWAHVWATLRITMTPVQTGPSQVRSGYMMTLLQKRPDGSWVIARDANVVTPAPA